MSLSKYSAKRAVHLVACKMLHEKGALDERLRPKCSVDLDAINIPTPDIKFSNASTQNVENADVPGAKTLKNMQWYRKKVFQDNIYI